MSMSENSVKICFPVWGHFTSIWPQLSSELFSAVLYSALCTFLNFFCFNQSLFRKAEMWYRYNIRSGVDTLRQWLSSAQQPRQRQRHFTPAEDWVQFNRTIFPWFGRQGRGNVILVFIPWWMYGSRLYFSGMCGIFSMATCDVILSRQGSACMREHTHTETRAHLSPPGSLPTQHLMLQAMMISRVSSCSLLDNSEISIYRHTSGVSGTVFTLFWPYKISAVTADKRREKEIINKTGCFKVKVSGMQKEKCL